MKHKIGDLVKTEMWFGTIVDSEIEVQGCHLEYKVHFWFPDDRLPTRWCSVGEINKWKKNLLDATK